MVRQLERMDGLHLVFVQYVEGFSVDDEWVYNPPNLESARIVFAHDLGHDKNRELIALEIDRAIWLVKVSRTEVRLERYNTARSAGTSVR